MSDMPENETLRSGEPENTGDAPEYKDEYAEYETIFGDPAEHRAKKPAGSKKRLITVISACLAVAVLLGGTLTVIKLIPKKETDTASTASSSGIKLLELEESKLSAVTVENSNGSFRLVASHTEEKSEDSSDTSSSTVTTTWSAEGVSSELTSSSSISSAVSPLLSLSAMQKIEGLTAEGCGLDAPTYKAVIETEDGSYTVTAGSKSYDSLGYYTSVSGMDGIYLVGVNSFTGLDFTLLDFADTASISGIDVAQLSSDYVSESGDTKTLSGFDSLTLSGANFPQPLVIVPNTDAELSDFLPYAVSSPVSRLADNITDVYNLFTSGLSVSGAYAFDVAPATLKKYGLDNPYLTVTLKAGNVTHTFKFSALQEDGCYAVIASGSRIVKKASASSVSFIDNKADSYYEKRIYISSLNKLSNMTFSGKDFSYSFDIVYDGSDEAETDFAITLNGKKVETEYFQNLYEAFVSLNAADFEETQSSNEATLSIALTYSENGSTRMLEFYPSSATKSVFKNNGKAMGRINTSELSRFIKKLESVAAGKDIS